MRLVDSGILTLKSIEHHGGFSYRTGVRLRQEWLDNEKALQAKKPRRLSGRPRALQSWAIHYIQSVYLRSSVATLEELQGLLVRAGHPMFQLSTLSKTLKRIGHTRKVTFRYAQDQSPQLRAEYVQEAGQYHPRQLVFIDESAVDWRNAVRRYGRSPKGTKAYQRAVFHRGQRYSVLPACSLDRPVFATYLHPGSMNGDSFFTYLKDVLLPECQAYPGPCSVIVMDNASIHHVPAVRGLIEAHGE